MKCRDIMNPDVTSVRPDDDVATAAQRMRAANVGFLPVCDVLGRVYGTLTDRDIALRIVADRRLSTMKVGDVMTRENVSCDPDDDLHVAEGLMAARHKWRIMCCEGDRLVGVISLADIAHYEKSRRRTADVLSDVTAREVVP